MHSRTFAMYSTVQCQCQCLLMCVTPVHACRWGLRVQCDDRRRGQQAHHLRQLETGELVAAGVTHRSLCLVSFVQLFDPVPVSSVLRWPPALWASFGFLWFKHPLPVLEKWGEKKRNLLQFCDGQMICVGSSGKSVFRTLAFVWVGSSCSHCTWAFSGVLSSVKVEISFLLT